MSPVSRGRGKKNRSAKGPLSRRAAGRGRPAGEDHGEPLVPWLDPAGASRLMADNPAQWSTGSTGMHAGASAVADGASVTGAGEGRGMPEISWVTIERWAREEAGPADAG